MSASSRISSTGDNDDLARRFGVHANGLTTPLPTRTRSTTGRPAFVATSSGMLARRPTSVWSVRSSRWRAHAARLTRHRGRYASDSWRWAPMASGVTLASAFIQISNDWGTYTAGKFGSFFDFCGAHSLRQHPDRYRAGTTDPNLFAWTFAGGNGFSFSISAEDPELDWPASTTAMTTTKVWKFLTAWRTSASTRDGVPRRSWVRCVISMTITG